MEFGERWWDGAFPGRPDDGGWNFLVLSMEGAWVELQRIGV